MGSNPVEALIFFRLLLSNCLNWKIYCEDHTSLLSVYCCFSRYQARTNSVAPSFCTIHKPHTTHNSSIRSNEALTLETSASESLYGGQFTLSTQLIKPNYLVILPLTQHHSFFRNLPPLFISELPLASFSKRVYPFI